MPLWEVGVHSTTLGAAMLPSRVIGRSLLKALRWLVGLSAATFLSACTSLPSLQDSPVITLPMRLGWVDGLEVRYVTTDVSDPDLAVKQGANYAYRLGDATRAPPTFSLLERVYKVANFDQRPVFQSAPNPVGSKSSDIAYSPLWRMTLVTWTQKDSAKELRSEQEILEAEDQGRVTIQVTNNVLNCPILFVQGRGKLPGVVW